MVNTQLQELRKEQEATGTLVSGLVDRLEAVTTRMKEWQDQSDQKWGGIQEQIATFGRWMQDREKRSPEVLNPTVMEEERSIGSMGLEDLPKQRTGNFFPKLEFPDFEGTNLDDWVYRSERFFELEQIPEEKKVKLASVYMYGKALQWHYTFIKNRKRSGSPSWVEYVEALTKRFGREVFEDPMGRIKNLKQEGAYENLYLYMEEFDSCLRKVLERVELPEEFQVSLFINGLKEEYRTTLWLLQPADLLSAQANARIVSSDRPPEQSGKNGVPAAFHPRLPMRSIVPETVTSLPVGRANSFGNRLQQNVSQRPKYNELRDQQHKVVRRRLSPEEVADRRVKGLCFACNEPYTREHMCPNKQLYSLILETTEGDEMEEGDSVTP